MKKLLFLILALCASTMRAADKVTITVSNQMKSARNGELVEVDAKNIKAILGTSSDIIITDADGREVASQLSWDGKILFQVGVAAKGKSIYYAKAGTPQKYEQRVFGRQFPERVDDIAWENDRVAFRCYGPALQRSGERAWGYDIWNKRTSRLIVEERYAGELDADMSRAISKLRKLGQNDLADDVYNAISYHVDHGNGMDCYKVGPTLGCGTAALLVDGKIQYPRCYKTYEILDRGPLRFTVRLVYGTENIDGMSVTETCLLSLDAGSHLNRVTVTYEGLTKPLTAAMGIVVHNENPTAYVLAPEKGYMCYEDLGDPNQYKEKYRATQNQDFGRIYVATVFTQAPSAMKFQAEDGLPGATGHILTTTPLAPTAPAKATSAVSTSPSFTYYFGTGWSRNEETGLNSLTDWEAYVSTFAAQTKSPLKITVK